MTTVYFIRHAQSDNSVADSRIRPLTPKGLDDRLYVTNFLKDKQINAVFSSPYKRSIDTVLDFAGKNGLSVEIIEDFKEHQTISDQYSDKDYFLFIQRYWSDMDYKIGDDESLAEVQKRNIAALCRILERYPNQNIVIGTHGIALSTILYYYDRTFGYQDFYSIAKVKPWAVKMELNHNDCISIEKINLFSAPK